MHASLFFSRKEPDCDDFPKLLNEHEFSCVVLQSACTSKAAKGDREMRRKIRNRAPAYVPFPIPGMGPCSTRNMKKKMCFFDQTLIFD